MPAWEQHKVTVTLSYVVNGTLSNSSAIRSVEEHISDALSDSYNSTHGIKIEDGTIVDMKVERK